MQVQRPSPDVSVMSQRIEVKAEQHSEAVYTAWFKMMEINCVVGM